MIVERFELSKKSAPARKGDLLALYKNGKAKVCKKIEQKMQSRLCGFMVSAEGNKIQVITSNTRFA